MMTDIPVTERLKALRVRAGVSMAEAAKALGRKTPSGYQHYEDPSKFTKRYLSREMIEKLLPVFVGHAVEGETPVNANEMWALGGYDRPPIGILPTFVPYEGPALTPGNMVVPIYSGAMGGPGHLIITFDPIEHGAPPAELISVKGAYGILIVGESMIPAFRPGDIAWVHPHRQPERDSDVVLYHVPPAAEAEAIIKTLVSWTPTEWKLRQYQPPRDFAESRIDWPVCHRIVGKKNVR